MKKLFSPLMGLICWITTIYLTINKDYQMATFYAVLGSFYNIMAKLEEKDD